MANKIKCPKCGEEIDIENLILTGSKEVVDKELAIQKSEYEKEIKKYKADYQKSNRRNHKRQEKRI